MGTGYLDSEFSQPEMILRPLPILTARGFRSSGSVSAPSSQVFFRSQDWFLTQIKGDRKVHFSFAHNHCNEVETESSSELGFLSPGLRLGLEIASGTACRSFGLYNKPESTCTVRFQFKTCRGDSSYVTTTCAILHSKQGASFRALTTTTALFASVSPCFEQQ